MALAGQWAGLEYPLEGEQIFLATKSNIYT